MIDSLVVQAEQELAQAAEDTQGNEKRNIYGFEVIVDGERGSGADGAFASEYSAIMVDRWLKCHAQLPQVDKRDLSTESSFLNGGEVLT